MFRSPQPILWIVIVPVFLWYSAGYGGTVWQAKVFRNGDVKSQISNLSFSESILPIYFSPLQGVFQPLISIPYRFERPGWKLYIDKTAIADGNLEEEDFHISVFVKSPKNSVTITAIGHAGERETEKIWVNVPPGAVASVRPPEVNSKHPWRAKLLRSEKHEEQIPGLGIAKMELPVNLLPIKEELHPFVTIRGKYKESGWTLNTRKTNLSGSVPTSRLIFAQQGTPEGNFSFSVFLTNPKTEIILSAIGPNGVRKTEIIQILSSEASVIRLIPPVDWGQLDLFLGISTLHYFQTGFGDFNSNSGLLAAASYLSPRWHSRWGLLAEIEATLFTFASTPIGMGPQIMQGNLDLTYRLGTNPVGKFQTFLLGGVNYLNMISNSSPFGFANLLAPEIGFRANYALKSTSHLVFQGRYIPVETSLKSLFSFQQQGVDLSLVWFQQLSNLRNFDVGLRLSNFNYFPDPSHNIKLNLFSIQVGYGF